MIQQKENRQLPNLEMNAIECSSPAIVGSLQNTIDELKCQGHIEEEKKEFKDSRDGNNRSHYDDLSDTSAVDS